MSNSQQLLFMALWKLPTSGRRSSDGSSSIVVSSDTLFIKPTPHTSDRVFITPSPHTSDRVFITPSPLLTFCLLGDTSLQRLRLCFSGLLLGLVSRRRLPAGVGRSDRLDRAFIAGR
ncbi:unnamed protein product [Pleuronectes platessa]|uniref:Uncharacterized protein n=1 Tax=Pleuronectes platessa TaxID=8262 RepID=A0A9N7YC09_PLEPL|nr:unnamed protein product [Pleuronectes platessa]